VTHNGACDFANQDLTKVLIRVVFESSDSRVDNAT